MILFDVETTGLAKPDAQPVKEQHRIIEFAAVKLDDETLEETEEFCQLIHPGVPLPPVITKITGITDAMLRDAPPFKEVLRPLKKFFLGEKNLVAHNLGFDRSMLAWELERLGHEHRFPWPPRHVCTVEASTQFHPEGKNMKLGDLYTLATNGGQIQGAHRGLTDVRAMAVCVRWLADKGIIRF